MSWTFNVHDGQIRDENGWVLGRVPFLLGDERDLANGRLMAAGPELLRVCLLVLNSQGKADAALLGRIQKAVNLALGDDDER